MLVGVITITDVRGLAPLGALAILEQNELVAQTKIGRVMTPNPITIGVDESVDEAARLMIYIRLLNEPVICQSDILGILAIEPDSRIAGYQ